MPKKKSPRKDYQPAFDIEEALELELGDDYSAEDDDTLGKRETIEFQDLSTSSAAELTSNWVEDPHQMADALGRFCSFGEATSAAESHAPDVRDERIVITAATLATSLKAVALRQSELPNLEAVSVFLEAVELQDQFKIRLTETDCARALNELNHYCLSFPIPEVNYRDFQFSGQWITANWIIHNYWEEKGPLEKLSKQWFSTGGKAHHLTHVTIPKDLRSTGDRQRIAFKYSEVKAFLQALDTEE